MRFHYLVAAHNEEKNLDRVCNRLIAINNRFPGSLIYLLDNGSIDNTWSECLRLQTLHQGLITALHEDRAGIGCAFRMGLEALVRGSTLQCDDWIILAAADLPFGFSDLESVLSRNREMDGDVWMYVGSKAHPQSKIQRSWQRQLATFALNQLRSITLRLNTKDTQGSIFIRGDVAKFLMGFKANDYFFSIEMIDKAERDGTVIEVAVCLEPELRPSRVRPLRDGWRVLRQLIAYRRTRKSV